MSQNKDNLDKLIEFIKDIMCSIEGEEFFIQEVNVYSPYYKFVGDYFLTGSLFIIANKDYIEMLEEAKNDFLSGLTTEKYDSSILRFQGQAKYLNLNKKNLKAVVLKYSVKENILGEKYYKIKSITNLKQKYPYLSEIVAALNKVAANKEQVDELINKLSKIINLNKQNNNYSRKR